MANILLNYCTILEKINIIPTILKIDIKNPIPKFSNKDTIEIKTNPANYRPLALQNIMYKILDGNLKLELDQHDEKYKIIKINQGGFKQREGANEHLYVLQNIFHYNPVIYCAFLDLKKAYEYSFLIL